MKVIKDQQERYEQLELLLALLAKQGVTFAELIAHIILTSDGKYNIGTVDAIREDVKARIKGK